MSARKGHNYGKKDNLRIIIFKKRLILLSSASEAFGYPMWITEKLCPSFASIFAKAAFFKAAKIQFTASALSKLRLVIFVDYWQVRALSFRSQ